jgi:hypothetical protein
VIQVERRANIGGRLSPTARTATIKAVLDSALKSGNIETAISEAGAGLSTQDQNALKALTSAELRTLASIQRKLTRVGGMQERADNNVIY